MRARHNGDSNVSGIALEEARIESLIHAPEPVIFAEPVIVITGNGYHIMQRIVFFT
jgi:hypothetical protein